MNNEILSLDGEIWRDIEGYNGNYEISNIGRIITKCHKKKRILGTYISEQGYEMVRLTRNNKTKGFLLHRLVAQHFISNPNNLPIVHHKDNIKSNNRVENLTWVTDKENRDFAWSDGRFKNRLYKKGLILKNIESTPNYYTDKNFNPPDEIWLNVKNFEGRYKISNYGRVITIYKCGEKFLKPRVCSDRGSKKPLLVSLYKNGEKEKAYTVHRLVAIHFIENCNNFPEINHKDGNRFNNHISNLEWLTHQDNMRHARETGLIDFRGEKSCFSKLRNDDIIKIRKLYEVDKISMNKLSKIYNMTVTGISNIINRKTWRHI